MPAITLAQSCDGILKERYSVRDAKAEFVDDVLVLYKAAQLRRDRLVRVLDAATGAERLTLRGYASAYADRGFVYAQDGGLRVSGETSPPPPLIIYDLKTDREVLRAPGASMVAPRFDAGFIVIDRDGSTLILDFPSGRERLHLGRNVNVSLSADGKLAAVANSHKEQSAEFRVVDVSDGREVARLRHPAPVSVAYFGWGALARYLISTGGDPATTVLWDVPSQRALLTLTTSGGNISPLRGSGYFYESGPWSKPAAARVIDPNDGRQVATLSAHTSITAMHGGRTVVGYGWGGDGSDIALFSAGDWKPLATLRGYPGVFLHNQGRLGLAFHEKAGRYQLTDLADGTPICAGSGVVEWAVWSPDGSVVAITFKTDGELVSKVYEVIVKTGVEARAAAKSQIDTAIAKSATMTPEGRQKAGALFSQAFELFKSGEFEAAARRFTQGLEIDPANAVAHFYLAETYTRQKNNALAHTHYQRTIDFAPDSKEAAIAETRVGK